MRPSHDGRIWASQGGLSRNKVAVGESAAGSPPTDRDQADGLAHTRASTTSNIRSKLWRIIPDPPRPRRRSGTYELSGLTTSRKGGGPIAQR